MSQPLDTACYLEVFEIPSLGTMELRGKVALPVICLDELNPPLLVTLQPDTEVVFISDLEAVVVVNVSSPSMPYILSAYWTNSFMFKGSIAISPDNSTLYVRTFDEVAIISLKPNYVLDLAQDIIPMGTTPVQTLNVFAKNSIGTYDASPQNYKFTNVAFYGLTDTVAGSIIGVNLGYRALPTWINFNPNNAQF